MSNIYTGKSLYPQPPARTIRELQDQVAERYRNVDAYIYKRQVQGEDFLVTYSELRQDIRAFAATCIQAGIEPGTARVGIIGENSYPWVIAYNAAVGHLGIAVPLDVQLPDQEALHLIERGEVNVLCFSQKKKSLAEAVAKENPRVKLLVNLGTITKTQDDRVSGEDFRELLEAGKALTEMEQEELFRYTPKPADPAAICFTSGTTADAKGVILSQLNIAANAHSCAESFNVKVGDRALSVLPLHHTFENTVGMFTFWYLGLTICINDGLRYIVKNMQHWHIGIMMVVPAIIDNIYHQIIRSANKLKVGKIIRAGLRLSRFCLFFKVDRRRKIFRPILDQLGGELHLFVAGGAPAKAEVVDFFNDIGVDCLPGYGLTEAGPVLATNLQGKVVPNSVGFPLPDVSLRIDEENRTSDGHGHMVGEVLAQGENIMLGYLDNPEANSETFNREGWLRTGDLGYFDRSGALHLTGRIKTMLVLNNGKKAFPEEIEDRLRTIPGVQECFVWDEENQRGSVDICAILQVKPSELPLSEDVPEEEIRRYLTDKVHQVNQKLPTYKSVNNFIWTDEDLIMTTTLKVKRQAQLAKIRQDLANKGLNIAEADGMRIPGDSNLNLYPDARARHQHRTKKKAEDRNE